MSEAVEQVVSKSFGMDDLMPMDTELVLNGKTYELRKINVSDEVWLKQFGDVQRRFSTEDMEFMCKLLFRLLKDKTDFAPGQFEDYDDDGNKIKIHKSGAIRIMEAISGPKARFDLLQALSATFGISRPMFNEMIESALKKSEVTETSPTGESSST